MCALIDAVKLRSSPRARHQTKVLLIFLPLLLVQPVLGSNIPGVSPEPTS